ncbi:MAG: hotdog fold thioesterase [Desulfobacula sp.]|jgi:1,4-dihydroxy-2-naphthoyl-CoA hydrolase|nr:hotdog fold thioesterase [Desulfobacula sp.]
MKKIWKKEFTIEELNLFTKETIVENVGIKFLEKGEDFISASMPVDKRTKQPLGILHGGASVVLAETLGSTASYLALDDSHYSVGLEIKANHIKSVTKGLVKGVVKPVHLGKTTQVWDISIENEKNELICVSRLTMLVLKTVTDQKENLL